MCNTAHTQRICELNDAFRTALVGGRVLITSGIIGRGADFQLKVLKAVQSFDDFDPDNDPYQEHDFGAITIDGEKVFWKLDYYDASMEYGSEDPADASVTTRVLTIMLAQEY